MFTQRYRQSISCVLSTVLLSNMLYGVDLAVDTTATAHHQANLDITANGVPLVNIVTPDVAGLSHNKFSDFNVNPIGLILNNATGIVSTQLGGMVQGNANLGTTPARVVLNEVTGTSRTLLRGYTEVAGTAADIIVANPNGITVNGGGFINTPRATLTTGTPDYSGGVYQGINVRGGDILIEGDGMVSDNIDRVDLYTKTLQLNAQIHAKRLDVITGDNDIAADGNSYTPQSGAGIQTYSIDSSVLGGIYANAITLIATDTGVGVNLPEITYASDSLTLNATGQIVLGAAVADNTVNSSSKSLTVNGLLRSGDTMDIKATDTLTVATNAVILSSGDINIHDTGTVHNAAGRIEADNDLSIQAGMIENLSSMTPTKNTEYIPERHIANSLYRTEKIDSIDKSEYKPAYILAGNDMLLDAAIHNQYSIIAADRDLYLSGSLNNEAAINAHYIIDERTWVVSGYQKWVRGKNRWIDTSHWDYYKHTDTITDHVYSTISAGRNLYGNLATVNNADITQGFNYSSLGVAPTSYTRNLTTGAITYALPDGGNGEYTLATDFALPYLIETNRLFTDYNTFVSSDYMMSRLNLNMANDTKRLGDARYETQLVRDAVFRLTGERRLAGFGTDTQQYQALMDNAINVAGDLQLDLGISLSSSQLAVLDRDIVWMEEKMVGGQKVLVPVIYLASLKNQELTAGGKIVAGGDLQLAVAGAITNGGDIRTGGTLIAKSDSLTNTSGSITAGSDMLLHTTGNITNTSSTISGNNVALLSDNGSITSQTDHKQMDLSNHAGTRGHLDTVGERAGIWAQGNLTAQADENINLVGSETAAGGSLALSGENITLASLEQSSNYKTTWNQDSSEIESVKQHAASLNAGGNVNLNSTKDITVNSSAISAGNNVNLTAGENVNITASNDREFRDVQTSSKGFMGKKSTRDMSLKETVTSSNISGENIAISSGKDTTLQAANLTAQKNIQVDATGDINLLAKEYREAWLHQESKSSLGGLKKGMSLDSADAIKLHEATVKTTAQDIMLNSGKDINVVASNMSAWDILRLKAGKDVNILSDEEQNRQEHYNKKSGLSLGFSDGILTVAEEKQTKDAKANITQKSSNLNGNVIALESAQDITSIGSNIVASTIDMNANRDVNLLSATESIKHDHKESVAKAGIGITLNMNEAFIFAGAITKSDKLGEGQTQEKGTQLMADNIVIHSGNNTNVLASNVIVNNDAFIQSDKNINILSQDATQYKNQIHEELKAGIKVGVQQHVTQAAQELADTAQSLPDSDNAVSAGSKVLKSVELITNTLSHAVSAGFDAIAEMSKSETSSQSTSTQSSTIAAGHDLTLDTNNEITIIGSDLIAGNKVSMDAQTANLKSAAQNASSFSSDKSESLKVTLYGTREGQVDASYTQSKNTSSDIIQRDTYIRGNDVVINTSGDTTLQGAHVSGNTITANVGGNLNLISIQDTGSSKGDSESISLSTGGSGSIGAGKSSSSKAWVNEQTGIIAAEKAEITVANNTNLQGAIIATKDAKGNDVNNVHLITGTLSASDISDHDKSTSMNIGIGNISPSSFQTNSQGTTGATLEAGYNYIDKEQINRATIGGGTITLANHEALPSNLNRDISKSQEIIKDESKNYDIYVSQSSIDQTLKPTQTVQKWGQLIGDMGLSVHKEITENLPNGDSKGFAGVVGTVLDTVNEQAPVGLLPSRANGGGYITQIATQLFGDNRTGIIVEKKETLLKVGVSKDDIQEVILIKTEQGVKKAEDFKNTDIALDTVTLYRTNPNKTVIIGDPNDKTGDPSLEDYKIRLSAEDVKKSGIDHLFTNGMFNPIDTATYNQQTQQGRADGILNYNQQHGIIGDLLESAQDAIAVNTGLSALGTGGARQTGAVIDQMATITSGTLTVGAHSQGTLMSQVAMEQNKEHLQELVQGNKDSKFLVGFAGSPVNHNIGKTLLSEIYGGSEGIEKHFGKDITEISNVFRSNISPQDAVGSFLGIQSAGINNSEKLGANIWNSLLSVPMLFGVGGDSSHSYYPCVIGCGNSNITPKLNTYFNPGDIENQGQSLLTNYYDTYLPHVNKDLLPSSQIQNNQMTLDTTGGQ